MYIAGVDAHTSYLAVAIVSKEGELLEKRRVRVKEPDRLDGLLARYRPLEVVVETSSSWPWLRDRLEPQGIGFILAHAKRLRWIARSNYKSDEVDAELLARMHLAGLIPAVHLKEPQQREWGRLVRHRARLVRDRTAWVNRIHGQLHQVGLSMARGRLLTRAGVQWLRTEAGPELSQEQLRLIRTHMRLIHGVKPMIRGLDRRIEQVSGEIPAATLVRTVPGIGAYRSLVIAAEVLPISRFPTPAHLVSYAGLAPVTRSSGGRTRHGSIPLGANRWLRATLVRTVVSHIQAAPESWLSVYYAEQKGRLGWQVARVAAARKLGRSLHAMLRTGEVWRNEKSEMETGELLRAHAAETALSR
jgi:transposase